MTKDLNIKKLMLLWMLLLSSSRLLAQNTAQVGTGNASSASTIYAPMYRFSAGSATAEIHSKVLYTQAELTAAGLPPGSLISELQFNKLNNATFLVPVNYTIKMANSTATGPLTGTVADVLTNINATYTTVLQSTAFNIPTAIGWTPFVLNTPFLYTGGALEVYFHILQTPGTTGATDRMNWEYTTGTSDYIIGEAISSNTNLNTYKHRPNTKFVFQSATPCVDPPTAGTTTIANTTVCPGSSVQLNLSGNSNGSGMSFQWQSSTDNITFTDLGTSGLSPSSSTTVSVPTWYRCKVTCGTGTAVFSNSVQVNTLSQFSGTYTINDNLPTAGTNFTSVSDAIEALNCGINGPVIFNFVSGSGPYNTVIALGDIPGTSATNYIRFNGNGVTLQHTAALNSLQMLQLDGTKYVTIKDINFTTTATSNIWGAALTGGCYKDSILNCTFNLQTVTSTTSASSNGITIAGSLTSATTTGAAASNCAIIGNTINGTTGSGGPYYGITMVGANDSNVIKNNTIANFYMYGIYLNLGADNLVEGNEIHRAGKTSVTTFYGIYSVSSSTPNLKIIGNKIHTPGGTLGTSTSAVYALYPNSDGTASSPQIIANNAIYNVNQGGTIYGIYTSSTNYARIYNNTVNLDVIRTGTSVNAGIYATGTSNGTEFKNNNISITGGTLGTKYGTYYTNANSFGDIQKNNIYVNSTQTGTQNYAYISSAIATRAAFETAHPTLEINSPSVNPQFVNAATGDLHVGNPLLMDAGIDLSTYVPTDINGILRSPTPTIGAFETSSIILNDGGIDSIISPTIQACVGSSPVKVIVKNYGTNNINQLQINWTLNGTAQTPITYTDTLVPFGNIGINADTVTLGTITIVNGNNNIVAWTSNVNNASDPNSNNDTANRSINGYNLVANASANDVCLNGTANISLTPLANLNGAIHSWEQSSGTNIWTTITGANANSFTTPSLTTAATYRAKVLTNYGGICYSNSEIINISTPQLDSVLSANRCGAGTVTLNAYAPSSNNIVWFTSATGGTPVGTGAAFTTPSINTTTTYYVSAQVGTGTAACATPRQAVIATVYAKPTVNIGNDTTLCPNANMQIMANATQTTTYLWSTGATTSSINVSTPGTYSLTSSNANCSTSDTIVITAGTNPVLNLPDTISVCDGQSEILNAANAGSTYIWSDGSTTPSILVSTPNTYTVTVTNASQCSNTDSTVFIVHANPVVNLGSDTLICSNDSLLLDASIVNGTYTWSTGSTNSTIFAQPNNTFIVHVTNEFNCSSSDTIVVGELTTISTGGFTFIPRFDVQQGQVDFSVIAPIEVDAYHWDFGDGNTANTANPSHVYAQNGQYLITLTVSNDCGSEIQSQMINVELNVGVHKIDDAQVKLNVFPNPSNGSINVQCSEAGTYITELVIRNMIGQTFYVQEVNKSSEHKVNVQHLTAGNYILEISTNKGKSYRKIMLQ